MRKYVLAAAVLASLASPAMAGDYTITKQDAINFIGSTIAYKLNCGDISPQMQTILDKLSMTANLQDVVDATDKYFDEYEKDKRAWCLERQSWMQGFND
jgi:hypothetical protein